MAETELLASLQLAATSRTYPERKPALRKVRGVRWARKQELGSGLFGRVWLETGDRGEQRAVKEIEKKHLPSDIPFERELVAMAKLSKVSPSSKLLPEALMVGQVCRILCRDSWMVGNTRVSVHRHGIFPIWHFARLFA